MTHTPRAMFHCAYVPPDTVEAIYRPTGLGLPITVQIQTTTDLETRSVFLSLADAHALANFLHSLPVETP